MQLAPLDDTFDIACHVATSHGNGHVYLLMDGARFDDIYAFIYQQEDQPDFYPLYLGTDFESVMDVGPCLLEVHPYPSTMLQWFLEKGADEHQAMLLFSPLGLRELAAHFQEFLEAKLPSMEIVLFRFYDPTVFHGLASLAGEGNIARMVAPLSQAIWKANGVMYSLS